MIQKPYNTVVISRDAIILKYNDEVVHTFKPWGDSKFSIDTNPITIDGLCGFHPTNNLG